MSQGNKILNVSLDEMVSACIMGVKLTGRIRGGQKRGQWMDTIKVDIIERMWEFVAD
jgi:hypothetical protein